MAAIVYSEIILSTKVVVVDYGMGNLWSVTSALRYLGAECVVSSKPEVVQNADSLILPGVGSFSNAMSALQQRKLIEPLYEVVKVKQRKILGICLGMQLMTESSTEDGKTSGLGFICGHIDRFSSCELGNKKIPHVGFNSVRSVSHGQFFSQFDNEPDFYFIHSYRLLNKKLRGHVATCNYGVDFVAAYQNENIYAVQFHPEKSQTNGLRLLNNFLVD